MFRKLFFALLVVQGCAFADDTYWENADFVCKYVHNSEMQRRWAMAFLAPHLRELKGDETILDIGCGDGKITADVSKFIPKGHVVGIDPSVNMLTWAKKQYCPLEYPNLTYASGGFLEPNTSSVFDVIISHCALQHCSDQLSAFKNMHQLLKPQGKLWIMVPAVDNLAWKQARKTVQSSPKWISYWEKITPRQFRSIQDYRALLVQAGFEPVRVEKVQTNDPFVDKEELLTFLLGTLPPAVPNELARDFYNELIDEYIRLLPDAINAQGVIEARLGRIEIEAKAMDYLYKVVSPEQWERSYNKRVLEKTAMDADFIHLATKEQLPRITEKFWNGQDYIILKVDPKKLTGRLVLEANPGGTNLYYHLYDGNIPLDAVVPES